MPKEAAKKLAKFAKRAQAGRAGIMHKPTGKGAYDVVKEMLKMAKEPNVSSK